MKKTISDYPELMIEWHPTLNHDLNPNNITIGSNKKCWWICNKGHEWNTICKDKRGCPYCSNQKACKDNCLAITHPEIAKEWHPTLNNNLTPNDVTAGSGKRCWWLCSKGHEWNVVCKDRSGTSKNNCPYCSNQKVCKDNCLLITHPELAKEWHPTKNGILTPKNIVAGSNKKCWWICSKGHEWNVVCNSRSGICKNNCPYCINKKVCNDNCLATTHPELAKEWHPTKNGILTPNDIVAGSGKKCWWLCSKEHEWNAVCNSRSTINKRGCPVCSESKGEKEVARILNKLNISYKREFTFNNCKNINKLPFDFVLKIGNKAKAIEYHGIQHYEPVNFGSSKNCKNSMLKKVKHRDKIKRNFCKSTNIPLLEISYKDYDKIEKKIEKFLSQS